MRSSLIVSADVIPSLEWARAGGPDLSGSRGSFPQRVSGGLLRAREITLLLEDFDELDLIDSEDFRVYDCMVLGDTARQYTRSGTGIKGTRG